MSCSRELCALMGAVCLLATACGESVEASTPARELEPPQGAGVAALERAQGDVRYRAARSAAWTSARPLQALHATDTVQTMVDARAAVRFRGSSVLASLGPSTTLRIPQQPPEVARMTHLQGRLVARLEDPAGRRLEVELPPGTLVLGAGADGSDPTPVLEARLDVDAARTEIAMMHGSGRLDRTRGEPLEIGADHFVALSPEGDVLESGRLGARATLVSPHDQATVQTRDEVRFAWRAIDGVSRYRLIIVGPDDAESASTVTSTQASVALPSGVHRWTVRAMSGDEMLPAATSRSVTIAVDRTPPVLTLTSPQQGGAVRGPVLVQGRTEPGARVWIDGVPVPVDGDGGFESRRTVAPGLVNLVVRATDALGNTRVVSRSVLREQ